MEQHQTNYRLWTLASACLFVAFGFVNPVAGVAKADTSLWATVSYVVTGKFMDVTGGVTAIVFMSLLLLMPALLLGWVVQAVIVLLSSAFSRLPADTGNTPNTGRVA
jgi:hypothetical protein